MDRRPTSIPMTYHPPSPGSPFHPAPPGWTPPDTTPGSCSPMGSIIFPPGFPGSGMHTAPSGELGSSAGEAASGEGGAAAEGAPFGAGSTADSQKVLFFRFTSLSWISSLLYCVSTSNPAGMRRIPATLGMMTKPVVIYSGTGHLPQAFFSCQGRSK